MKTLTNENQEQQWIWGLDKHHSSMAAYSTTNPVTLASMVEDVLAGKIPNDYELSWDRMFNKRLPFEAAEKLAKAWPTVVEFGFFLVAKPDATPDALDEWADSEDLGTITEIASHPNTKLETLLKLTRSPLPYAAFAAVSTGRLPPQVVDKLSASDSDLVRQGVARVSREQSTLKRLATDPEPAVRLAVAENPSASDTIIEEMARADAQPSLELGKLLAKRLRDPALLQQMSAHPEAQVRLAVVRNPHTAIATVTELALNEQHPSPVLCKAIGTRLPDPALLQSLQKRSVVVKVIPKGATQVTTAKHNYRITMQSTSRGATKVILFADGIEIGERTTYLPSLYASVCSADQAYAIRSLQSDIPRMREQADFYDRIQARDASALAELDRRWGYAAAYREESVVRRDRDIANGKYSEEAKATRQRIVEAEARLTRLMSGPLKSFDVPDVDGWHERADLARRRRPGRKLVDIIEIVVP